jgi:membrane protein DedA with SNARE-associated domain
MTVWLIIGAVVGGGLGWLLGRYNSRRKTEGPC